MCSAILALNLSKRRGKQQEIEGAQKDFLLTFKIIQEQME